MHVRESMRVHPLRWIVLALLILVLIVVLAGALIIRSLLQPQRFTALLQSQLAQVGLVLNVQSPAAPELWPHPAVQLQGFSLSNAGASTPLLSANEARIVVPWRALLHRELLIERIEIDSPRIDLDQLQTLLARLPHTAGAPQLPRIGAGVTITDGVLVRGDTPLLLNIDAQTGPLLPNAQFKIDLSAQDNAGRTGALSLRTLPVSESDVLHFEHIGIGAAIARGTRTQLTGNASWRGDADIDAALQGTLTTPVPQAITANTTTKPAASSTKAKPATTTATTAMRTYAITLGLQAARGVNPLTLTVKLDGADEHIDAQVPPLALIDWWHQLATTSSNDGFTLPPLRGHAQIDNIDVEDFHVRGVRIDAGPDIAPLDAPDVAAKSQNAQPGVGH